MTKGSGEPQKLSKIAPPSVPPPEAVYEVLGHYQWLGVPALVDFQTQTVFAIDAISQIAPLPAVVALNRKFK